jgi:hypothetical protein
MLPAGARVQVIESLPGKRKGLSSNPSIAKKIHIRHALWRAQSAHVVVGSHLSICMKNGIGVHQGPWPEEGEETGKVLENQPLTD